MNSPDKGWFDAVAGAYARNRPSYPSAVFSWIAERSPERKRCWDAACGSGQASIGLAEWFDAVEASDLSPEQIAAANPHPRVRYRVGSAEASELATDSIDAVVVAAAIHWLDVERFNQEVLRVLRPKGLLVWLGYDPLEGAPAPLQQWLNALYYDRLGKLWPPERVHVDRRYADLPFPVPSAPLPDGLRLELHWSADDLLGFISTWSALRRADASGPNGNALIQTLAQELAGLWPREQTRLPLHLPLMGRWGVLPP